jgi:hypothetical protein
LNVKRGELRGKPVEGGRGKGEVNEGMNMVKVFYMHV